MNLVKWFSEISEGDVNSIGYNAYDLSLLYKSKFPIANGFCITKNAWGNFLSKSDIKYKLEGVASSNPNSETLNNLAEEIKGILVNSDFNFELKKEINEAYSNMSVSTELHGLMKGTAISFIKAGREMPFVVISTSFENQDEEGKIMYIVKGIDNILLSIKKCLADGMNAEMLGKLVNKEVNENDVYPAIIVQKMVNSSMCGNGYMNDNSIVINAYWGLLGLTHMEKIKTDRYKLDDGYVAKDIELNNQANLLVLDENIGRIVKREVPLAKKNIQILNDNETRKIGKIIDDATSIIGSNKQIEWAVEEGRLFITNVKRGNPIEESKEILSEREIADLNDTITNVSISIDEYEDDISYNNANGVGLLSSLLMQNKDEYFDYIRDDMPDMVVNGVADRLIKIAGSFSNKDVWYKLIDKADKFYDWRYKLENVGKDEELIGLEIAAIKKARNLGFKNIGLLLPLVNDAERVRKIKTIIKEAGLEPCMDVKIGVVIDNPAGCQMINEICNEGINFLSIDVNRLAKHTLTVKKDEINEMHPAVIKQIASLVDVARKNNVKIGVSNFNPSMDMIERLVKMDIDNIAASNDDYEFVMNSVAKIERRLLLSVARDAFKRKEG